LSLRVSVTPWPVEGFSVFGAVYAAEGADPSVLQSVAREFSPRIEVCGPREITLDQHSGSPIELVLDPRCKLSAMLRERDRPAAGVTVRGAVLTLRLAGRLPNGL